MPIHLPESDPEVLACFPVMVQLRPHLTAGEFLRRVRRQQDAGFQLAAVAEGGRVLAVAGFRILEMLAWGRLLYVDDLVTDAAARSQGHGRQLFDWLLAHAQAQGCEQLHLDSGVQRFGAHRFYLRQRMDITCHHFAVQLRKEGS